MRDLALHPQTHDLFFENGNIALNEGPELFAQQLRIRLKRQLGEWMWDTSRGIPYREEILVRNPNVGVIAAHFKSTILGTPNAIRLESFDIEITDQMMSIRFEVVTLWGKVRATGETNDIGALALILLLQPIGSIL